MTWSWSQFSQNSHKGPVMGEEGKVILRHFETPQGVSSEARHKSPLFCEVPPLPGSSEAVNGAIRQILEPYLGHVPGTVGNSSPKLIWGICQEFGGSPTRFRPCSPPPVSVLFSLQVFCRRMAELSAPDPGLAGRPFARGRGAGVSLCRRGC